MANYKNELQLLSKLVLQEISDGDHVFPKAFVEIIWPNGVRETIEITDADAAGQLLNRWVEARRDINFFTIGETGQ